VLVPSVTYCFKDLGAPKYITGPSVPAILTSFHAYCMLTLLPGLSQCTLFWPALLRRYRRDVALCLN